MNCSQRAPRIARFYRGRDMVAWLHDMGHYDMPVEKHRDGEAARLGTNHYVPGRDGGLVARAGPVLVAVPAASCFM